MDDDPRLRQQRKWRRPSTGHWPVRAEHHRPIVTSFGDNRHRPGSLTVVDRQVSDEFHHGSAAHTRGRHGVDPGIALGEPGPILPDEPSQPPVAVDLAGTRIVDHHLAGPHRLQRGYHPCSKRRGIARRDRPGRWHESAGGPTRRRGEVRKPRHRSLSTFLFTCTVHADASATASVAILNLPSPGEGREPHTLSRSIEPSAPGRRHYIASSLM